MPMIPVFCEKCGAAFSSGIFIGNCKNLTLSNNSASPCPRCGGTGYTQNGTFNIVDGVIETLSGFKGNIELLNTAAAILTKAIKGNADSEELAHTIREEAPELASLADTLPKTRMELYAVIALILTILKGLLSDENAGSEGMLERSLHESMLPQNFIPYVELESQQEYRESRCICGSGKKNKNCCGKLP